VKEFSREELLEKIIQQGRNIERLLKVGASIASNSSLDVILETVLEEVMELTGADGGTVYLVNDKSLDFKIVRNRSLDVNMGGESGAKIDWKSLPMYKEDGSPNLEMVAVMCAIKGEIIDIDDIYESNVYNFEGSKKFDKVNDYLTKSMMVFPMKNHEEEVIGVLQLINRTVSQTILPFSHHDEDFLEPVSAQAAVAITKTMLINDLENLLEAFLKSIAVSIDEKSPYTSRHIGKVVEITELLTNAVDKDTTYFSNVNFNTDQKKQNKFAAWMHDIGKITTPEYIIDKSTKLETLFDRIEVIDYKFNILKQNVKIQLLENKINQEEYQHLIEHIDDDFKFLKKINKGDIFLTDDMLQRIKDIALREIEVDGQIEPILTSDEVFNLSIRKGTLLDKEREVINDHAYIGFKILEQLPFPKKYKRVPEIASDHHEKLNGKGYPFGKEAKDISIEARILAIADVFEALTAPDRPYKEPYKLSQSMKILYLMAKDGEFDIELVKLFYESGAYKQYANKFMKPSQIDDVPNYFES
jgi:HD-GYP domain-containing protein (c-di-GMP phosphodiesterase class II)